MGAAERKIRFGIVGGNFARDFHFDEHPNCQVAAVAELNPARRQGLRDRFQCDTSYETLEELLADTNVEAVGIFTGAPDHARHSIAALKAGKHVLSAVPAAFSLEECAELCDTVQSTGLTYMMAETTYYRPETMQAREWYREGRFGELFYSECEYWHENLEEIMIVEGQRSWRYGLPPMHYPTHSTAFLISITGERLTQVQCFGWGDNSPILKDNAYNNPFWNEVALFQTDRGHPCRVIMGWHVGHPEVERASWFGSKFSYVMPTGMGQPNATSKSRDVQKVDIPNFYERLPEKMRHGSGHGGSHNFLVHEFFSALIESRQPVINVYEALAYTAPGIVAHQSALRGGEVLKVPVF